MRAAQPLPLRARLAAALVKLAFGWLYASGLSQLVLKLNGLPATPLTQLPLILALLLLLALLTWSRYQLLASGGTALQAALLLWLRRSRWLPEEGWPVRPGDRPAGSSRPAAARTTAIRAAGSESR